MRIKKSVKTREGREIVRPFFVSFFLLRRNSEINKFIPFEFGESRETNSSHEAVNGSEFFHPENFYHQLHFLRFEAQEFCGRILRQHDEESETISWTRSSFSPRGKKFIGRFYKSPPAPSSPRLCNPRLEHVHKIYRIITIS